MSRTYLKVLGDDDDDGTSGLKNEQSNLTLSPFPLIKGIFVFAYLLDLSLACNSFCHFFTSSVIHGKEFEINLFYKGTDFLAMKQQKKETIRYSFKTFSVINYLRSKQRYSLLYFFHLRIKCLNYCAL